MQWEHNKDPAWDSKSHYIFAQKAGMCQQTALNDGVDGSQKGKSPVTRSVVCCLQQQEWSILCKFSDKYCWMHVYKDDTKNLDFFTGLQSDDICKIL